MFAQPRDDQLLWGLVKTRLKASRGGGAESSEVKQEGCDSLPRIHAKESGTAVQAPNSRPGDPWGALTSQPASELQASERPSLKPKRTLGQ